MNAITAVRRLLSRGGEPSRRTRRAIVILAVLGIAAIGLLMAGSSRGAGVLVIVVPIAVLIVPLYALQEFRRNVFKRENADERERRRRDEAYRLSYRVIEFALPLLVVVLAYPPEFQGSDWVGVWIATFSFVLFLPYMVFAWREPDVIE